MVNEQVRQSKKMGGLSSYFAELNLQALFE